MADKVMKPTQPSRSGGIKQTKSGIVEGPTASSSNVNPYCKSGKGVKK